MAEQLVKGDQHEKGWLVVLKTQVDHILRSELHGLSRGLTISVSKVDILETEILSDVVVVRNVDTDRNTRRGEGQNIETGKVWLLEFFYFELFSPSQVL